LYDASRGDETGERGVDSRHGVQGVTPTVNELLGMLLLTSLDEFAEFPQVVAAISEQFAPALTDFVYQRISKRLPVGDHEASSSQSISGVTI
jgi:hypothetical protein